MSVLAYDDILETYNKALELMPAPDQIVERVLFPAQQWRDRFPVFKSAILEDKPNLDSFLPEPHLWGVPVIIDNYIPYDECWFFMGDGRVKIVKIKEASEQHAS